MATGQDLSANGDKRLWIMPAVLEVFGFSSVLKAYDTFDLGRPWHVWVGYGATGTVLIIAGVVWAYFRKKIADLWPWRKLHIAEAELTKTSTENQELKRQMEELKKPIPAPPSKLTIHSAIYRALLPNAKVVDVTDCLRQKIAGDSLAFQIQNANFRVGDQNWVEDDPCEGQKKWLQVEYSFDSRARTKVDRREDYRLVLPEDTFIKAEIERLQDESRRATVQQNSDLWRAREFYRQSEEERRAALKQTELLSPLQVELLNLSTEIAIWLAEVGPQPTAPAGKPMDSEELIQYMVRYAESQNPWEEKIRAGFALRFEKRAVDAYNSLAELGISTNGLHVELFGPKARDNAMKLSSELWRLAFEARKN